MNTQPPAWICRCSCWFSSHCCFFPFFVPKLEARIGWGSGGRRGGDEARTVISYRKSPDSLLQSLVSDLTTWNLSQNGSTAHTPWLKRKMQAEQEERKLNGKRGIWRIWADFLAKKKFLHKDRQTEECLIFSSNRSKRKNSGFLEQSWNHCGIRREERPSHLADVGLPMPFCCMTGVLGFPYPGGYTKEQIVF